MQVYFRLWKFTFSLTLLSAAFDRFTRVWFDIHTEWGGNTLLALTWFTNRIDELEGGPKSRVGYQLGNWSGPQD